MAFGFGFGFARNYVSALFSAFSPASLFSGGAPGVWYDPSDYGATGTLFQDSAGTTPVTAVEQPVGLMLDKSQGLVLGSELVTNGDFSNGTTGWNTSSWWTISSSQASMPSTTAFQPLYQAGAYIANRWYRIDLTVVAISGGIQVRFNDDPITANTSDAVMLTTTGSKTFYLFANTGTECIAISRAAAGSASSCIIDNISVKELPGNHAFQATSASRPVLSARYNLLTKTEQLEDSVVWARNGLSAVQAADASGLNKLVEDSTTAEHRVLQIVVLVSGSTYRIKIRAKAAERTSFSFYGAGGLSLGPSCLVDLSAGTISGGTNATISNLGDGIYEAATDATSSFTGSNALYIRIGNGSYAGNGTSGIFIGKTDFKPANQSTLPYQRVNTATDYNTVGFLPYLKFDGVDDSFSTNSINFTSTDKMSVFAGVRKLSDAAGGMLVNLSANTGSETGVFLMWAPFSSLFEYAVQSRGTAASGLSQRLQIDNSAYAAPVTNTITGLFDIPNDSSAARINGVSAGAATGEQGAGSFGNYPIFIGRLGGTTLPYNGQLYSMIIVGKAVTANELSSTEKYTASKTGVTLA